MRKTIIGAATIIASNALKMASQRGVFILFEGHLQFIFIVVAIE